MEFFSCVLCVCVAVCVCFSYFVSLKASYDLWAQYFVVSDWRSMCKIYVLVKCLNDILINYFYPMSSCQGRFVVNVMEHCFNLYLP